MLGFNKERILFEKQTTHSFCQVVEKVYSKRPARLLYSGKVRAAQSGIGLDSSNLMLFGYNQRFMEIIEQLPGVKNILLIGGGVYTLPTAISEIRADIQIDVVEPNTDLDDIATEFFNFNPKGRATIHHLGGKEFLNRNKKLYDLIIIDAYHEDQIPDEIRSESFALSLRDALKPEGFLALNVISNLKPSAPLSECQTNYSKVFNNIVVYSADYERADYYYDQNFILVATSNDIVFRLKYPPLASSGN
ncbi:MAG TPA: fused MFS/spermidine synthase [Candidatus Saccharimonadales bacterium]